MNSEIKNPRKIKKSLGNSTLVIVYLVAFLISIHAFGQSSELTFRMELSKKEIFVGEQVFCNFVVYTRDEMVEVEVEKFPDFRGYWKDNLALRQGPIPTSISADGVTRKAIVGSYLIIPMLGDIEPIIDPMKIVVRDPAGQLDGSPGLKRIVSEGLPPQIKRLPPITNKAQAKLFHGAVGNLTLAIEKPVVNFKKDEPFVIRFSLAGEGNFQDLNDLNLVIPEKLEVLSKKAMIQGSGQFFTKIFEYTLVSHSAENWLLDPLQYLVFNPATRKYTLLEAGPVHLQREAVDEPVGDTAQLSLPPLDLTPGSFVPWTRSRPFWAVQFCLLVGFVFSVGKYLHGVRAARREGDPAVQRQKRWQHANRELRNGHFESFLRLADQLACEVLSDKTGTRPGATPRSHLLSLAHAKVPEDVVGAARTIFQTHDDFLFSPTKEVTPDTENLARSLSTLMQA